MKISKKLKYNLFFILIVLPTIALYIGLFHNGRASNHDGLIIKGIGSFISQLLPGYILIPLLVLLAIYLNDRTLVLRNKKKYALRISTVGVLNFRRLSFALLFFLICVSVMFKYYIGFPDIGTIIINLAIIILIIVTFFEKQLLALLKIK